MSSGLMDTERGGEQTQYEGIATHQEPHDKRGGQLGSAATENDVSSAAENARKEQRGAQTAENVRYGQAISEGGMSGKTTEDEGIANRDVGYGGSNYQDDSTTSHESRQAQGYGQGSGVGG